MDGKGGIDMCMIISRLIGQTKVYIFAILSETNHISVQLSLYRRLLENARLKVFESVK